MFVPREIINIILEKRTDLMLYDLVEKVRYKDLYKIVRYNKDLMKRSLLYFNNKSIKDVDILELTEDLMYVGRRLEDKSIIFNCFKTIFENSIYIDLLVYDIILNTMVPCFHKDKSSYWKDSITLSYFVSFLLGGGETKILKHIQCFVKGYKDLIPGLKDLDLTEEQIYTSFQIIYKYIEVSDFFYKNKAKQMLDEYSLLYL